MFASLLPGSQRSDQVGLTAGTTAIYEIIPNDSNKYLRWKQWTLEAIAQWAWGR